MLNPQQFRGTVVLFSLGILVLSQVSTTVGGDGCNANETCIADMERYYLAGLQAKILSSLHLHSPLRNVTIPKISQETLAELLADDKDETSSKRVIFFSRQCAIDMPNCIAFDVSQSTLDIAVDSKLRFYVDLSSFGLMDLVEGEAIPVSIKICRVLENGEVDEYPFVNEVVNMEESQRMEMDIELRELKNWKAEGDIELKITAEYENGQATINLPTLVIDTEQPRKRDRRNSDNYCPAGSPDKTCCLHDMIIDFQKLGWHFIMAPRIYNAYMCRGDCDSGINHILRFGHSKLLKDAHHETANNCCHPSDYESLKIIYTRADNEVIITRVPGMIARRCSCS